MLPKPVHFTFSQEDINKSKMSNVSCVSSSSDRSGDESSSDSKEEQENSTCKPVSPSLLEIVIDKTKPRPVHFTFSKEDIARSKNSIKHPITIVHYSLFPPSMITLSLAEKRNIYGKPNTKL